jgi:hypothetical protein
LYRVSPFKHLHKPLQKRALHGHQIPAISSAIVAIHLHHRAGHQLISMRTANQPHAQDECTSSHPSLENTDGSLFGPAPEDRTGRSYNEAAFRYFLMLERKRSERAGRPFLLLLVDLKERTGLDGCFDPRVASRLFDALWSSVRDTDFLGWYRERHVVGAVLTDPVYAAGTDIEQAIQTRVGRTLRQYLRREVARGLHVRIYQVPTTTTTTTGEACQPWL